MSDFHNYARHDVAHSGIDMMFLSVYSIFICLFAYSQIINIILIKLFIPVILKISNNKFKRYEYLSS